MACFAIHISAQLLLSEEQKVYEKDIWNRRQNDTFSDRSPTQG